MTSRDSGTRTRKTPTERRQEIVRAAALVGLAEGLECITLRRIADQLGVQPGLVSHYFPAADILVAEAFTSAARAELDALLPEAPEHGTPLSALRRFFALIAGTEFDNVSKLWMNARHLSRYRPSLRDHVIEQELLWCRRIEQLIAAGADARLFRCADPWASAVRILVAIDGTSVYINTSAGARTDPIADLARTVAETELGLPSDALATD
ncbi:TetR family transcriptional regulator C-terminal domain-containing protein [Streptomyces sp. NPDC049906]|uniref:TetR/AcrR family transcriptional regulator n=1 Tax=Streptomyces sp. NPDC049906 TaxID=3155656 RepID=UPI0034161B88